MTTQGAIETLKLIQGQIEWDYPMEYAVAVDIAVDALEKQIPKKVNYKKEDRFIKNYLSIYSYCPVCEKEVFAGDMFCVRCGQRICWREEET